MIPFNRLDPNSRQVDPRQLPNGPTDGNRQWTITSAPTVEPVTVEELKLFGRIDGSDEDALLASLISAVRMQAEEYTGRAFITQTIRMVLDYWPRENIELPRPPLQSITAISIVGEDGSVVAYDSSKYFVVAEKIPGEIVIKNGNVFPLNTARYSAGIRIDYKAGYGDAATAVPEPIKSAIKMWTMDIYESRGKADAIIMGNSGREVHQPSIACRSILNLFKVINI